MTFLVIGVHIYSLRWKIYRKKMTYFIALYACNMQIQVKSIGKLSFLNMYFRLVH